MYGEHRGSPRLRELIVADQAELDAGDVLITGGAATALFIVSTSLLGASDHLVVVRPNYATNLETPRAIGCSISFIDLQFETGFRLDFEKLAAEITPRTRLVSVTCPHNPSGVMFTAEELRRLAALTQANGCYLLVDETYRDLSYDGPLPLAATLGPHVISVSSLSKAYGIPGIRIGWLICRDPKLQETFLAAKEQISICGSVIDEWIAEQVLARRSAAPRADAGRDARASKTRRRMDRAGAVARMRAAAGWCRLLPSHASGTARRNYRLLPAAAGDPRNLCGSGSLVRDVGFLFPPGLWLAHSRGTRGGTYRDFTGAAGLTMASELFSKILEASAAIYPQVSLTPLEPSSPLSAELGCQVLLKYEHMQPTGSFKIRGATNKVRLVGGQSRRAGVLTASTGNHGVAVARAGGLAGVPVKVYVSNVTVPTKLASIRSRGAELVIVAGPPLEAELAARRKAEADGLVYISPYNDLDVIAGQGTLGVELLKQEPELAAVFIAVGAGGLIGGVGSAIKALNPRVQVVGVWPEASQCMLRALEAGQIIPVEEHETLSDGTLGAIEAGLGDLSDLPGGDRRESGGERNRNRRRFAAARADAGSDGGGRRGRRTGRPGQVRGDLPGAQGGRGTLRPKHRAASVYHCNRGTC